MGLDERICRAVAEDGYQKPTPIQAAAIPDVLAGRDLLGCAQTGTGKTAAFSLPIIHRLGARPSRQPRKVIRALILTPTRELALQIMESLESYGRHLSLTSTVLLGGVSAEPQKKALRKGIDILVATPGRLIDLKSQGLVDLSKIEMLVLDEADRMLDMGFIHDVKRILAMLPPKRQNLLFSATMPREIESLAATILKNPAKVEVAPVSSTAEMISQKVYFVDKQNKRPLLLHVLAEGDMRRVLVFTRTKNMANRIAEFLDKNEVSAEAIHGNKSQNARQRALANFKAGKTRVLVASDIASRGLDIDEISHVINFELTNVPETYVHRIGRTGRAQASGTALSFCDLSERDFLRDIERVIGKKVPVMGDHPFAKLNETPESIAAAKETRGPQRGRRPERSNRRPERSNRGRSR
jgi:ATP-dependent RNA helicase RhlE